jgi:hypothetical protein
MIFRANGHVKMLSDLSAYIENLILSNEELRTKLNDWNKDEEIQKLKGEIDEIRRNNIHLLSSTEKKDAQEFSEKHYYSCKGNTSYTFVGTGIGTSIKVRCTKCNKEKDITDISNW